MDPKPKVTQAPQQLSPMEFSSPFARTDMVSSTSGADIDAGEKRKKAEVIDLTSDEGDPPLKRRKLSVDSFIAYALLSSIDNREILSGKTPTGSPENGQCQISPQPHLTRTQKRTSEVEAF
jgi:hypothetical protein